MKKLLVLLLCAILAFGLVACTEDPAGTNTDSVGGTETNTDTESNTTSSEKEWAPLDLVDDLVIACDQKNTRLVIYDLGSLEKTGDSLDGVEEWSMDLKGHAGTSNLSGVKYREDTVFGDVIIAVASGGYAGIIKYPSKEVVWEINSCGNNPHSIEILPNGNVVCAASTGASVRLYYTSALLNGDTAKAKTYKEYKLTSAHGVLWDPTEEVLWALGGEELLAYGLEGETTSQTLTVLGGMGGSLPKGYTGGHDLSPDYMDKNYLYVTTNKGVLRFNKDSGEFATEFAQSDKLSKESVKGFGNNPNYNFIFANPNKGEGTDWANASYADWCTNVIHFGRWKSETYFAVSAFESSTSAFYKVRVFYGQYQ